MLQHEEQSFSFLCLCTCLVHSLVFVSYTILDARFCPMYSSRTVFFITFLFRYSYCIHDCLPFGMVILLCLFIVLTTYLYVLSICTLVFLSNVVPLSLSPYIRVLVCIISVRRFYLHISLYLWLPVCFCLYLPLRRFLPLVLSVPCSSSSSSFPHIDCVINFVSASFQLQAVSLYFSSIRAASGRSVPIFFVCMTRVCA